VHCVVPGGGIAPDGEHWIACRPGFFLPVRVLSRLFRRLFLAQLRHAFDTGALHFYGQLAPLADAQAFAAFLAPAAQAEWVVYAKPPFGDAQHVLDYLGRYTHRVAISNNRLVSFDDGHVTFRWKDYKHPGAPKTMTLEADQFIRRFLLHVLPDGFKHIRSYGLLANRHRSARLATCRQLLGVVAPPTKYLTPWKTTETVTSDSPASHCAIAPSAARVTWSASKPSCPAHCRVRRHPLTMFIDPCSHHDRSRFHAFRMATRPALRHRVFATGERPATGTADLVNNARTTLTHSSTALHRRPVPDQRRWPALDDPGGHSMPIEATACGAVQHKRFFIYRSRANLDGSTHASEAATNKQKILCMTLISTSLGDTHLKSFHICFHVRPVCLIPHLSSARGRTSPDRFRADRRHLHSLV
jgi:hypothetical protein